MGQKNSVFLEVIEWFDPSGEEMACRIPGQGSAEIKYGAQLTVRESQAGVFFYNGKAIQVFGPGRHTLKTANIPLLTKVLSIPWGLTSPLRAEVYFLNMKLFTSQKWGTRDPVAFKDSELGLVRLRAFGLFTMRIIQPLQFVNFLVGTVSNFSTGDIEEYLNAVIISRLNDYLGETLDTMLNLPGRYDAIAAGLQEKLREDFGRLGLGLHQLIINSITPPREVQQAIDDRSRLGILDDLDKLTKMKAAMSLEKAAGNPGGGQGMGMGLGLMMPAMLSRYFEPNDTQNRSAAQCPECRQRIPQNARFCPSCGHQIIVFLQCAQCGKNLSPSARFCSRCGRRVDETVQEKTCGSCGTKALPGALFCNQCGERL